MKKLFSYLVVLLWMALIFFFSHQPASNSNELSEGITEVIVTTVEKVASSYDLNTGNWNYLIRKNAHFFIYLMLGVLVMNSLKFSGLTGYKKIGVALVICVFYAISDEVHQLFVSGRGAQVIDVLIDSAGASVGIGIDFAIGALKRRKPNGRRI